MKQYIDIIVDAFWNSDLFYFWAMLLMLVTSLVIIELIVKIYIKIKSYNNKETIIKFYNNERDLYDD
tara:strand:+ start:1813 stop:2013 length:201 start_codon:yes stop_codon:yes gene_type:complete